MCLWATINCQELNPGSQEKPASSLNCWALCSAPINKSLKKFYSFSSLWEHTPVTIALQRPRSQVWDQPSYTGRSCYDSINTEKLLIVYDVLLQTHIRACVKVENNSFPILPCHQGTELRLRFVCQVPLSQRHLVLLSSQKTQQVSKAYNESYYRIMTEKWPWDWISKILLFSITQPLGTTGKLATFLAPVSQSLSVKWD